VKNETKVQGREGAAQADAPRGDASSDGTHSTGAHSSAEKIERLQGTVAALRGDIEELQRQFAAFRKQFE
jgi:hypothetical protein